MQLRSVLTIGGSDSSGGAGIQVDLKTFSALGVYGTSVLTALTAQNASGVQAVHEVPADMVTAQIVSLMSEPGFMVAYAKTGMLYSSTVIEAVAEALRSYNIPFVLDPVMKAGSGGVLLEENASEALIEKLVPLCQAITPNVYEASCISGIEIHDREDAEEAALRIHEMGAPAVIIKGGHLEPELAAGRATDLLYDGQFEAISLPALPRTKRVHGAGCAFSAALTAELATGKPLRVAASSAKRFVYDAISSGDLLPSLVVVNPTRRVRRDADRYQTLENVKEAVRMLRKLEGFANWIPEVGTNIGMAVEGAEDEQDIAAVDGRIVRRKEGLTAGCVEFGASSHVARLILAMMTRAPDRRSAMNIAYSPELVEVCRALGLLVSSFERAKEPATERTMDWGVREASRDFVPDVIYDLGAVGKEPMVRIFGTTAVDVVLKLQLILEHLR